LAARSDKEKEKEPIIECDKMHKDCSREKVSAGVGRGQKRRKS
jgi:hypothetical protein